jgi:hypothetical protein
MDFLQKPPKWLTDSLPEGAKDFLEGGGWWGVLAFVALIVILIVWAVFSRIGAALRSKEKVLRQDLTEDLAAIPTPAPSTGDRRLTIDGVPVRLRLVVVAAGGTETDVSATSVNRLLDKLVTGLGEIVKHDQPRVRIWPTQLSYDGFAHMFHKSTPIPEGERAASRWVLVAGRAKLGGEVFMIGLGLHAIKPTSLGRRTLKDHEWAETFRIKVRE